MGLSWRISCSLIAILVLSACEQNGGAMPLEGRKFLSGLEGPKIPTVQDNQMEVAREAEKNNDFAQASQMYQQILDKTPEATEVIQLLADSLRRNAEYNKAVNVYDSLIAKNPDNIAAKEGKALALLEDGDFESPTILFEEVLRTDGKRWKSLNGMGILFVTRGLHLDALKYFEEALKQSPNNISVMNNLGLARALNKQFTPATDILLKAVSQSKVNSTARKRIDLNLALVYASAGKLDEAKKIATTYLSGAQLNNNLGLYAHLAKDDAMAKSYLNMALTESKTYYGKAWDNLESLGGSAGIADDAAANEEQQEETKPEKSKKDVKKASKNQKQDSKNESKKITIVQEPPAVKSEVKSLGEIMVHEIKQDGKVTPVVQDTKQPAVMSDEVKPKEKRITVDSVIDDMAKNVTAKTVKENLKEK